jgi:precorrin-6B methylase 1
MQGRPSLFLTSGAEGPGDLCRALKEAGLGDLPVTVGEDLGQKSERIVRGTAAEFAGKEFAPLNLLLAEPAPRYPARTPGIPDGEFLREQGVEVQTLPGVSSLQVLAAKLGRPWQDWLLRSAHGTACDPVPAVMQGRPALFLTSGAEGPGDLCRSLTEAGLGDLPVTVGEDLGLVYVAVDSEAYRHVTKVDLAGNRRAQSDFVRYVASSSALWNGLKAAWKSEKKG